jgi:hypothetical protein
MVISTVMTVAEVWGIGRLRGIGWPVACVGVPGRQAADDEPALVVCGLLDAAGILLDPLVVEAAQGCEVVDVGGGSGFPAAAGVVEFAQPGRDLTALGRAAGVAGEQGLALAVGGEAGSAAQIQWLAPAPRISADTPVVSASSRARSAGMRPPPSSRADPLPP